MSVGFSLSTTCIITVEFDAIHIPIIAQLRSSIFLLIILLQVAIPTSFFLFFFTAEVKDTDKNDVDAIYCIFVVVYITGFVLINNDVASRMIHTLKNQQNSKFLPHGPKSKAKS